MTEAVKGTPLSEFQQKFETFQHMVTSDLEEHPDEKKLGKTGRTGRCA